MTFKKLLETNNKVRALYEFCKSPKHADDGAPFCQTRFWKKLRSKQGAVGTLFLIRNDETVPREYQQLVEAQCRRVLPTCDAGEECELCRYTDREVLPECGPNEVYMSCSDYLAAKNAGQLKVGVTVHLLRDMDTKVFGLLDGLRHEAARLKALEERTAAPSPLKGIDLSNLPNDDIEPLYIVRSGDDAARYTLDLKIRERLAANEITRGYARNCFYVCDEAAREAVMLLKKRDEVTGDLSWRPVVLTFADADLENKLQEFCKQVVTVLPNAKGVMSLAAVKASVKILAATEKLGIPDMPEEVLDGWLGRLYKERMSAFPIAFAWPALLTAASVLVPKMPYTRANLFTVLVAGKGTGKSSAFDYALKLLDVQSPPLMKMKVGSAEQLGKKIGDVGGASRLYYTDELEHLLLKAAIQGATFATVLNTAFNEDAQEIIITEGKDASMNCRLSVAGGVVDERFNDLFGACTTGGFYDRFIFGVGPTNYSYSYRAFSGQPALQHRNENDINENILDDRPVPVEIHPDVWDRRDAIAAELKISPAERRVLELGIRCAVIAASFDGRRVLYASDLGPMKAFVEYQIRVRKMLKPNPGKNPHAIVGCKFRDYLDEHSPNGEWVNRRKMVHDTRAGDDWGAVTVNSVLQALAMAGDIEMGMLGRAKVLRAVR